MTTRAGMSCRRRKQRTAVTLVEVMVSLLILGSTITGILLAESRCVAQIYAAQLRLSASETARELIANWRIEGADLRAASSGRAPSDDRWSWERSSSLRFVHERIPMVEVMLRLTLRPLGQSDRAMTHEYRWLIHESKK